MGLQSGSVLSDMALEVTYVALKSHSMITNTQTMQAAVSNSCTFKQIQYNMGLLFASYSDILLGL